MDILDQRSLALIPRRIRWIVLGCLILATLLSAGFAVWLVGARGSDSLAGAILSIFKASAIGTALWFFFLVGQRAQSRTDLLRRTSEILKEEIPASLRLYGKPDELEIQCSQPSMPENVVDGAISNEVKVDVTHVAGTVHARYKIYWPGVEEELKLRVHLNVKVMSLVYYFPEQSAGRLAEVLKDVFAAGEDMGWKIRPQGVHSQRHLRHDESVAEVHGRMKLSPDFLHESTERLFIANDLAAMTRAIMITWSRRDEHVNS